MLLVKTWAKNSILLSLSFLIDLCNQLEALLKLKPDGLHSYVCGLSG